MKNLILILFLSLASFTVRAQEKKNKNAKYDIEVKGKCEMCKKRIEKAALSVTGVKSADWHQDAQILHLILDERKTSDLKVQNAVAKAGHDTGKVLATDQDYTTKLHACCAYDRN